jgi:hypothetical protein
MSWSHSNADRLSVINAVTSIKEHTVASDNKAQQFGHVAKVKELALRSLEQLPENAMVRFSINGHTDSEEVWQGGATVQFSVGY